MNDSKRRNFIELFGEVLFMMSRAMLYPMY